MAQIEIPKRLEALLGPAETMSSLQALIARTCDILRDNKLPFFPDYTDHGIDHINAVLRSEVALIPNHVWEQSDDSSDPRLLTQADAVLTVAATLLHDLAMHLHPDGFLELINDASRFKPLPWFDADQEGHLADRPWNELWENYAQEACRFSDSALTSLIGSAAVRNGWKFASLPDQVGRWERNHFLIVGEFIRRHHARLAHEIAMRGFPGLPPGMEEGQFPALGLMNGDIAREMADLIGVSARSHGTSLRVCKTYLDFSPIHQGTPKPMGSAALFIMALLRVADYFQIDRKRAPAVLLHLHNPTSPISVQEWNKHLAVRSITPATDPRGIMVTVSKNLDLKLYLQLQRLVEGLQSELDHSTAVIDEVYGLRNDLGLDQLGLNTRRVYSNLQSRAFRESLPYIPEHIGFSSDANLFSLLVEPLYGKHPGVGVRELVQNAVDAVTELNVWANAHKRTTSSLDLPKQDSDVLVEFIRRADHGWLIRVRDKGIGMTSKTIKDYFLRAGASFRYSPDWAKEFVDVTGKPRLARAGRFGVGAFALFLLGPHFRVWTRHASAGPSEGYSLSASFDSEMIEINRQESLVIGTTVEVDISDDVIERLGLNKLYAGDVANLDRKTDWFCWHWPKVIRRIVDGKRTIELQQQFSDPLPIPGDGFAAIHPKGFDAVYWSFHEEPRLVCNGIKITTPNNPAHATRFVWPDEIQLRSPDIAILDSSASLPLTVQRYELSRPELPFLGDLSRDVMLSFIAHALVCGPCAPIWLSADGPNSRQHPLTISTFSKYIKDKMLPGDWLSKGLLRWCSSSENNHPLRPMALQPDRATVMPSLRDA